ncbi:MAG: Ig-like domain-containing protein [Gemmatimonadaceae bacterium]
MRKSLIGVVLVAVAACSGKESTGPGTTTGASAVRIAAVSTTVTIGSAVSLTAIALDSKSKPVSGVSFSWTSETPAVATVDQQGNVQGVTEGTAVIRATTGAHSGTVAVNVNKDYCANALGMSVGQVRVLAGPSAVSCLTLAATTGATDYLLVTANASPVPDLLGFYNVSLSQVGSDAASDAVMDEIDPRRVLAREAVSYQDWTEAKIRADESLVARRVFSGANRPTRREDPMVYRDVSQAVVPAKGDAVTYHVPNINSSALCTSFTDVHGTVKAIGKQAVIVQDDAAPTGGFTDADYAAIAAEFDDKIYQADTLWFGAPTDRNGDGHITILYTPEVNKATPAGSAGFTAGFFWGGDLFKKSEYPANNPCPATNEQEIFYLLTPDPSGTINNNIRTTITVRQGTRGVIAHEFQHMINQSVRMFNPAVDSLETSWLNEAMSHFAEEAVGRTIRGFGDQQALTFEDVNPGASNGDDYNAFFRQNFARLRTWMVRPDTASPVSIKARTQLAPRGAGWLLVRYTADQYGNGNPKAFFRRLAAGPAVNVTNLETQAGVPFDDILSGYLVAVFADDYGIAGLPSRFTIPSWNLRDAMTRYNSGTMPLQVTPLPGSLATQSLSGSGNYFRYTRASSSPQIKLQMLSSAGTPVSFDGARIYVVRIN